MFIHIRDLMLRYKWYYAYVYNLSITHQICDSEINYIAAVVILENLKGTRERLGCRCNLRFWFASEAGGDCVSTCQLGQVHDYVSEINAELLPEGLKKCFLYFFWQEVITSSLWGRVAEASWKLKGHYLLLILQA